MVAHAKLGMNQQAKDDTIEATPTEVVGLRSLHLVSLAVGRQHTLALVPSLQRVSAVRPDPWPCRRAMGRCIPLEQEDSWADGLPRQTMSLRYVRYEAKDQRALALQAWFNFFRMQIIPFFDHKHIKVAHVFAGWDHSLALSRGY